jgi:hypothetical protein
LVLPVVAGKYPFNFNVMRVVAPRLRLNLSSIPSDKAVDPVMFLPIQPGQAEHHMVAAHQARSDNHL